MLIADERKIVRQGLISLFTTELGILVVGDSGDGVDTVEQIRAKTPDVALVNVKLPKLDGPAIARRIADMATPPELVFMANRHNESLMREVFAVGARAYLLQQCDFKELVFAIRKVASGDYYLTGPAGREMVMEYVSTHDRDEEITGTLTPREMELARLLAEGYSTREAADWLNISIKTAETHRASIMRKLDGKNVTDIVKFCIRNNIIQP